MVNVAPYLFAYVVGIVVVFLRRRRAPKASALALTALTLMFLSGFLGSALQGSLLADHRIALSSDLWAFAPEVTVSATILLLLLARLFRASERVHLGGVAFG